MQRRCVIAICALAMVCFAAVSGGWSRQAHAAGDYRLGSGDKVRISVFGEEDLSGEYEIDGSGVVAFPLVGEVKAAGGTARDLERKLSAALRNGYLKQPVVSIEVLTYRPFFILGEVKRPGSYPYKNGLTVLNAVALAGGYTYRAKENRWLVTRGSKDKAKEKEVENGDYKVLPGDTIFVPERFF